MIKNTPEYDAFRKRQTAEDNLSHEEAFEICDALYQEALSMGTMSSENIWDGFEAVLRIAKAMQELMLCRPSNDDYPSRRRVAASSTAWRWSLPESCAPIATHHSIHLISCDRALERFRGTRKIKG
jgi:hypothetical protein